MLRNDGHLYSNGQKITDDSKKLSIEEGDVIVRFFRAGIKLVKNLLQFFHFQGVAFDHVELSFFHNGAPVHTKIHNVKGVVFPALFGSFTDFYLTLFGDQKSLFVNCSG